MRIAVQPDARVVVTQVGRNWNQLVSELNGWHRLGRDLEDALNDKENPAIEPVR